MPHTQNQNLFRQRDAAKYFARNRAGVHVARVRHKTCRDRDFLATRGRGVRTVATRRAHPSHNGRKLIRICRVKPSGNCGETKHRSFRMHNGTLFENRKEKWKKSGTKNYSDFEALPLIFNACSELWL